MKKLPPRLMLLTVPFTFVLSLLLFFLLHFNDVLLADAVMAGTAMWFVLNEIVKNWWKAENTSRDYNFKRRRR